MGRKSDHLMAGSRLFERNDLVDLLKPLQEDAERRITDTVKTGHEIELPAANSPPSPLPQFPISAWDWLSWAIWIGLGALLFASGFYLGRITAG